MSTSTIRGTIQNFSPKLDEGYYGVLVDTGKEEKWLNGNGDIPDNLSKGDKVKIEANTNGFIEINDVEVVGSGSEDSSGGSGSSSDMDARRSGEGAATDSYIPKNRSTLAQKALEEARKLYQHEHDNGDFDSRGAYMEQLTSTADGFFNWMLDKAEAENE